MPQFFDKDAVKANLEQILSSLISFNTTSRDSNLEAIYYIEKLLLKYGIKSHIDYNKEQNKANLFASIGPKIGGGIIFSGHTDVVPVDGQDWHFDPFTLTNGKTSNDEACYFGRGTCDMKGFIATILAFVPFFIKANLKIPVYLCFSYDEEIGCRGVPSIISYINKNAPKPLFAIIGEPTNMQIITAHKTINSYITSIKGLEAHSSNVHKGVSAINYAVRLINALNGIALELREDQDPDFDPSFSTINIGIINGGTAVNIIAGNCEFAWDLRTIKKEHVDFVMEKLQAEINKLQQEMQLISSDAKITNTPRSAAPGLVDNGTGELKNLLMKIIKTNKTKKVSFATEAGIFQKSGIEAIICGPGSIEQAHKPNEFILHSQLDECIEFIGNLGSGFLI